MLNGETVTITATGIRLGKGKVIRKTALAELCGASGKGQARKLRKMLHGAGRCDLVLATLRQAA